MLAKDPSVFGLIYNLKFSCNFSYFIGHVSRNTSSNGGNTNWSTIPIPECCDEVGAARSLATTGFTLDEGDNVYMDTSSYLTKIANDPQVPPGAQEYMQGGPQVGSHIPLVHSWPEVLPFTYSEHHRRRIPVVPFAHDTGCSQDASFQMSGRSLVPLSRNKSGGAIPKPESVVPLTEDMTMSSVDVAAHELLPDTPPSSAFGELDEDMSIQVCY
jgi:hypothetical protein